ncbi:hypothetical protein Hanom_Chr04g00340701 [Helianthus anomalus]
MFLSTNILIQYLSGSQFHDCGHVTHWLTRRPIVTDYKECIQNPTYRQQL